MNSITSAFKLFFKKFQRIFITPFLLLWRKILRFFNPQNIVSKVATDVKDNVKDIPAKPKNIKQYFIIGDRFVAKKLVLALFLVLIVIAILVIKFLVPFLVSKFFTKSMWVNSAETVSYSGKVKLYSDPSLDKLIFEGVLDDGQVEGEGTLYNYDGVLVYFGNFVDGQYSGSGKLYEQRSGKLQYEGEFSKNLFNGTGKLYKNGKLLYDGGFDTGKYNGQGKLYNSKGTLIYDGGFYLDKYDGQGREFYDNGNIKYIGEYLYGKKTGKGTYYDENGQETTKPN